MRSEALDILIEDRGDETWIVLSGPFHREQIPNIRSKFTSLLEDGNRFFVADLETVTMIDQTVPEMFLAVLNEVRAKGGDVRFVFRNELVMNAFAPYRNLLAVFPDAAALSAGGFLRRLKIRGKILSKKTGVRISRPVSIFLLFVLCGWFLTLLFIIHLQHQRLVEQEKDLNELAQWKEHSLIELNTLKERLKPLEQLGILRDTIKE